MKGLNDPIQRCVERSTRGAAMLPAIIAVTILAGMSAALLSLATASGSESGSARDSARALYMAEAGLSDGIARFQAFAERPTLQPPASLGTQEDPIAMGTGSYWVDVDVDQAASTVTLTSYGRAGLQRRAAQVVLTDPTGGVFAHAVFAGNDSLDPTYSLDFSGNGDDGDLVNGDIFSAGNVGIYEDAEVTGTVRAGGVIAGAEGEEGVRQPTPDLRGMNYEVNNDIDVLAEFSSGRAQYQSNRAGGSAWQMPEDSPAHIFRANPSDRASDWQATEKTDFFLEDPYERVRSDSASTGEDAYHITLSGTNGDPGPSGTDKLYFIDGNLWVHNKRSFSLKFFNPGEEGSKVTFVVKGNIYFSDNIFLENPETDGVAFIAMGDDQVEDSGNIYFGDPSFGTLEYMAAFMYAENNFYDNNLAADGSARVEIRGNMSAGNQVAINRDFGDHHSKLTIDFDDRLVSGELDLPGLPSSMASGSEYVVVSWREVAIEPQP